MKVHDVEQGSLEWHELRLGMPTASNFHRIITPARLERSKQARAYAFQLVAEKLLLESSQSLADTEWMERGRELEPQAIQQYEFTKEVETKRVGFCTTDDGRYGASPDRLIVGRPGGVEVKCPSPHVHLSYLVDGPGADYRIQKQGQILVCEFDFADFYSFHPALPPADIREHRDEAVIAALKDGLEWFLDMRDEIEARVRALGFIEARKAARTPHDVEQAEAAEREIVDYVRAG